MGQTQPKQFPGPGRFGQSSNQAVTQVQPQAVLPQQQLINRTPSNPQGPVDPSQSPADMAGGAGDFQDQLSELRNNARNQRMPFYGQMF